MEKNKKFSIGDEVVRRDHVICCATGQNNIDPMVKVAKIKEIIEKKDGYVYKVNYHEHPENFFLFVREVKPFAITYLAELLKRVASPEASE